MGKTNMFWFTIQDMRLLKFSLYSRSKMGINFVETVLVCFRNRGVVLTAAVRPYLELNV